MSEVPCVCALSDCRFWREADQGCYGEGYWPLEGGSHKFPVDVSHKCCGYRPREKPQVDDWFWPQAKENFKRCLAPEGCRILERLDEAGNVVEYEYEPEVPTEVRVHLERLTHEQAARRAAQPTKEDET